MSTATCTHQEPADPFFTIGSGNGQSPVPVPSGTVVGGNTVGVDCSVSSNGTGGYSVNLAVSEGTLAGITISGTLTDTPGPQTGIQATFTANAGGSAIRYSSPANAPCTMTLSSQGMPPISAGRVWGTLTCDTLTDPMAAGATCLGAATLLFEDCSE